MVVGSMTVDTDVVIIGSGPGGYVAAIRAAQLGLDVMVIEEQSYIGGVCLHTGCIPTKAVIHASNYYNAIQHLEEMGIHVGDYDVNIKDMLKWKQGIIEKLESGVKHLFEKYGIEVIEGRGIFESATQVRIEGKSDVNTVRFKSAIVATGSSIIEIPKFPFSHPDIIGSTEALALQEVPKKMVIIGGGYIGTELGTVYGKLGTEVHIIEMTENLISVLDPEIVSVVEKKLAQFNVVTHKDAKAESFEEKEHGLQVTIDTKEGKKQLDADKILVVVGRRPNSKNIGLEEIGVSIDEKGFVVVDEQMRTSQQHIFAIGDVAGQPMLAHKATRQAKVAAEVIAGKPAAFDNRVVPAVVFNDPELVSVGLTEKEAQEQGYETITGKFPYAALGRALTLNAPEGFIKIIAEKDSHLVLGVHAVGPNVSDIIGEVSLAIEMGAVLEDVAGTIHPHPTVSESLVEAAEVALGSAIHIYHPSK